MRRLAITLTALTFAACGAETERAPEADYWLDRSGAIVAADDPARAVGIRIESGAPSWVGTPEFDLDVGRTVRAVEEVCGELPGPIVTVWKTLGWVECNHRDAAGCYHHAGDLDRPYIEIATSGTPSLSSYWSARMVGETSLIHELCHHASGIDDTQEFAKLVSAAKVVFWASWGVSR